MSTAADELVQWGKEEGPYARLRALGAGEGDSRFGAAIRENSSRGSEKRADNLGNGELHRGHKQTVPIQHYSGSSRRAAAAGGQQQQLGSLASRQEHKLRTEATPTAFRFNSAGLSAKLKYGGRGD